MKKYFLILAAACTFTFAACGDKDDDVSTNVKTFNPESVQPYKVKIAPVQEGQVTTIKVDGQIICRTTKPMQYSVPNGKTEVISYAPASKTNADQNFSETRLMLCFEDIESNGTANILDSNNVAGAAHYGDFNDFVCYVKIINREESSDVYIQPIALGSVLPIDFYLMDGENTILNYNAVRTSLFKGRYGYINTVANATYTYNDGTTYLPTNDITYCKHQSFNDALDLNNLTSYIVTHGDTNNYNTTTVHFASMNTSSIALAFRHGGNESLTSSRGWTYTSTAWYSNIKTGAPVGIAFAVTNVASCFQYPQEFQDINSCYNFYNWIFGETFNTIPLNNANVFTNVSNVIDVDIDQLF